MTVTIADRRRRAGSICSGGSDVTEFQSAAAATSQLSVNIARLVAETFADGTYLARALFSSRHHDVRAPKTVSPLSGPAAGPQTKDPCDQFVGREQNGHKSETTRIV